MLSNTLDRISFWALFVVVVLLPIFFLPFSSIPVETSKGLLLIVGLAVSIIFWAVARFSDGKITLPRSWFLISGLGIVLVFLLSAFFSTTMKVSFFGTMLDPGTFWFMLSAFLLMLMSAIYFRDSKNAKVLFLGVVASSVLVLVFQVLHLFVPNMTSFGGILAGKTGNVLGAWNALAIFAGLFTILSVFTLEFFSIPRLAKLFLWILIALSVILVAVINFPTEWIILGLFALFVFIYKISLSIAGQREGKQRSFPATSFAVMMISLIFFMSGQLIGGFLPNLFGISNTEVRPSFVATLQVTKSVLLKDPILGAGPNKFTEMWNLYKPKEINDTIFWNTSFNESSGLMPTFAVTTGVLGILAWLSFLALLLFTGFKLFFVSHREGNLNIQMALFFMMSFYLFIVSLFYPIGPTLFLLAFAFLGVFIGLSVGDNSKREMVFSFLEDTRKSFFAILVIIIIMMASVSIVFRYSERFVSIIYFQNTLVSSTIEKAESNINKAVTLYSNDLYLRTYSQVYLLKANALVSKATGGATLSDAEKAELQTDFDQATKSAQLAVAYNQTDYLNWESLGSVYEAGVLFGATGALDKAVSAYQSAATYNPLNPSLKLDLARLYFNSKDLPKATEAAKAALALKPDYIDAFILLSQIAKNQGNSAQAITYAQSALSLSPQDTSLQQYLTSLQNGSAPATVPTTTSGTNGNIKIPPVKK